MSVMYAKFGPLGYPPRMSDMEKDDNSAEQVDFGFSRVEAEEKLHLVRDLFDRVAGRYDLMNDLMSAGTHRLWKREMIDWLAPKAGSCHLDVAGGTGDIAFRVHARQASEGRRAGEGRVIVCDLSENMVLAGRARGWDKGILDGVEWLVGDGEALPVATSSVDAYTIAFGIRNVTHIEKVLEDAARVLKPGGRFMCLEFSPEQVPGLDKLYELYSFNVIPWLGDVIAGDRDSYRYLVESIRRFPAPERFAEMIREAGFGGVTWRPLSGGIAALHSGWRV
jgi:demethylmenaquinone methyltransferase/2-methoxy-6-polyprenyl-1,4-benzoquinol methylase